MRNLPVTSFFSKTPLNLIKRADETFNVTESLLLRHVIIYYKDFMNVPRGHPVFEGDLQSTFNYLIEEEFDSFDLQILGSIAEAELEFIEQHIDITFKPVFGKYVSITLPSAPSKITQVIKELYDYAQWVQLSSLNEMILVPKENIFWDKGNARDLLRIGDDHIWDNTDLMREFTCILEHFLWRNELLHSDDFSSHWKYLIEPRDKKGYYTFDDGGEV